MTPRTRAISTMHTDAIVGLLLLLASVALGQTYTHDQDLHPNATASFILTANDNATVIQADYR